MPSSTEIVNKKCGEIIITIKKNAKNVYSFNCWFCDTPTPYIQMKKFTLHMQQQHEMQLEREASKHKEDSKPEVDAAADRLFIPEIKVEDFLVDDIKSENEEENHVTRNSKKKETPPSFQDPLETIENEADDISLPMSEKQPDDIFADLIDTKIECSLHQVSDAPPKEDIEMETFSDDNDNVNDRSDVSADENSSSSDSDYKPEEDEGSTKRAKPKYNEAHDKVLTVALINAFKDTPQLWDTSQSEKCSIKQKEELLQTITDNLNGQLKMNMKLYTIKKKINELCREYEKEVEGRMTDEKKSVEKTDLWYYEHMEFLKPLTENKLKLKRKKPNHRVKPLSGKLMDDLIDIYKNYSSLWDVNHLAFTVKDKRHETMQTMLDEIKTKMNLSLNIYKLEKHLAHIHKSFAKDKQHKLECEKKQQDFQPSSCYYTKCDFLDLHQGPFRCPTCSEIIETYKDFQLHKSTHDGTAPFKCQECGMGFKKLSNFKIHAKRHLRVFKFHCEICGKGYPFNAELDLHMRSHTGAQPYLCSVCGEGFRTAISYDNHIRRHEERFKYFCHICKKGFNHMTRLNDHVKAHLNVRDVICTVCGKGFTSRKYLNHHKRIHEGKNYICNICGKRFAQDAGLRAHKKYHGTPIGISSIQKEQNKYNLLS